MELSCDKSAVTARHARIEPLLTTVMRGLDPRIHLLAKSMDCRVKPGNDNRFNMTGNRFSSSAAASSGLMRCPQLQRRWCAD
jgi:hypothetical protein